jgi:hypothetical protein
MKATLIVALDYEKRRNSSSTMLIVVVNFDGRIWKKKKVVKHLSRPWLSPKSGNNSEVHLTILDEEILKWVEHNTITQTCQYKKFLKATRTSSPYTWFESFTFQSFWSFQEASERHSKRCVKQRSRLYTSPIISKNWSSYKKLISPKNYHFEVYKPQHGKLVFFPAVILRYLLKLYRISKYDTSKKNLLFRPVLP